MHKVASVLAALHKSTQPTARKLLAEICDAEDRPHAVKAIDVFAAEFAVKWPKVRRQVRRRRRTAPRVLRLPRRAQPRSVSGVTMNPRRTRRGITPREPGHQATVDIGELGTVRGSLQDRDLVTERDELGFEHPARFAADGQQLDDGDEQPVDESAKSGTELGGRAGSHGQTRLRPVNLAKPG